MRFRIYQHCIFFFALLLGTILLLPCCRHIGNKQAADITVTYTFPDGNWTFDEQVLNFNFDITDTSQYYSIGFVLNYDSTINVLASLPLNITLVYPDKMETYVTSQFNFDPAINKDILPTGKKNVCNMPLVAFPKKKLNQKGTYTVILYRKAEKYDNYGFNTLTLKVKDLGKSDK